MEKLEDAKKNEENVRSQFPPPTAKSIMSSPVRTVPITASVQEARKSFLRYGHTGLGVVDEQGTLVGVISRRDIDIALHHGLGYAAVAGFTNRQIKSVAPDTSVSQMQHLMMTYDIGRLLVLKADSPVGIVTRTDLLRALHQASQEIGFTPPSAVPLSAVPEAKTLYQQLESRIADVWPALLLIAGIADKEGWALYLVGGAVRDLLLSLLPVPHRQCHPLTDIDLVVDGAGEGAGVALAEAIQSRYPQVNVQIHGQFQTAALVWSADVNSSPGKFDSGKPEPLSLDIATARTEFYPYPAANPEVEASTIHQDLYRRDFTINAMAIRLNGHHENGVQPGQLLDFFGGWLDLQQRHVRVIHANSFIEDPTRIFRAVRFAVRLGFSFDAQTEQFVRYAISSGIYSKAQASPEKTPALQTRLKAELRYMLSTAQWEASLTEISRLGALACLHSSLQMTPVLWQQLRRMSRWLNKFDVKYLGDVPPQWLMLLELLIAQLAPPLRDRLATDLNLNAQSQHRLKHLHLWEADLIAQMPKATKPSQIYRLLKQYERSDLLLVSDRHPYTLGSQIWQYIVQLSHQSPLINGGTLKKLGYKPGPQFKQILTAVHYLTLDLELSSAQGAEDYVLAHYPLL